MKFYFANMDKQKTATKRRTRLFLPHNKYNIQKVARAQFFFSKIPPTLRAPGDSCLM
jgi:hypothetical protein